MALQCPKCPLKFDLGPMLADHLQTDHRMTPEATRGLQPAAARVGLVNPRPSTDETAEPDRSAEDD